MRLKLEATKEELLEKSDKLIESLAHAIEHVCPDLAERLEKALPAKETQLKFLALRQLKEKTDKGYDKMLEAMNKEIGKVLDRSLKKSGIPDMDSLEKAEVWVEIPEFIWDILHDGDLHKAAGHKYLRRWRAANGKYRYEYKVLSTGTLKTYRVGDKVSVKYRGKEGHFEVIKERTKDGKRQLYVKHDETDKEFWISEIVLGEMFRQTHSVKNEAYRALDRVRAALSGYDPEQGPAVQTAKPTKQWAKVLEKRKERLMRLFDPYDQFHSMMDYGAKQELFGIYQNELKEAVDQFQPIMQAMSTEVEAAREKGDFQGARDIATRYWEETAAPLSAVQRPLSMLVSSLNFEMSKDESDQTGNNKHSDKEVSEAMQAAWDASQVLPKASESLILAFSRIMDKGRRSKEWAKDAKSKVTRYFNLVQKASVATTAARTARDRYRFNKDSKVTDYVAGKDVKYLLHAENVTDKSKITDAISSMELSLSKIKKAGFQRAIRDLTIHLDWTPEGKRSKLHVQGHGDISAAGLYHTYGGRDPTSKGDITVFNTGFRDGIPSSVLTHEVGHRFYYKALTEGQRDQWETAIAEHSITPTNKDIEELWTSLQGKAPSDKGDEFVDWDALEVELGKHGAIGKGLIGSMRSGLLRLGDGQSVYKTTVKDFVDSLENHPLVDPFVSFYGGTNESEYFAEAFMFYVQGGRRNLPSWTRSLFEEVTSTSRIRKSEENISDAASLEKARRATPIGGITPGGKRVKLVRGNRVYEDIDVRKPASKQAPRQIQFDFKPTNDPKTEYKKLGPKAPAFKAWFGDWEKGKGSRVVKKDGSPQEQNPTKPIPVFHGTSIGGFTEFKKASDKGQNIYGPGFYFTEDKGIAAEYTHKDEDSVAVFATGWKGPDGKEITHLTNEQTIELLEYHGWVYKGETGKALDLPAEGTIHIEHPGSWRSHGNNNPHALWAVLDSQDNKGRIHLPTFLERYEDPSKRALAWNENEKYVDKVSPTGPSMRGPAGKLQEMLPEGSKPIVPDSELFEVYLNIRNPLDMDTEMTRDDFKRVAFGLAHMTATRQVQNVAKREPKKPYDGWKKHEEKGSEEYKNSLASYEQEMTEYKESVVEVAAAKKALENWPTIADMADPTKVAEVVAKWQEHLGPSTLTAEKLTNGHLPPLYLDDVLADHEEEIGKDYTDPHNYDDFMKIKDIRAKMMNKDEDGTVKPAYGVHHIGPKDKLTWGDFQHIMTNNQNRSDSKLFNDWVNSAGYDGIAHTGGWNIGTKAHRVWIAFEPTQIKKTANEGTFDPAVADMSKAITPKPNTPDGFKDHTKVIADRDDIKYIKVKTVLMQRGYIESDFEEGGPLYGYSVNQLIDMIRDRKE